MFSIGSPFSKNNPFDNLLMAKALAEKLAFAMSDVAIQSQRLDARLITSAYAVCGGYLFHGPDGSMVVTLNLSEANTEKRPLGEELWCARHDSNVRPFGS